ncbi:MAG: hypothetical protein FWG87_13500 [Defluviitaleaceae bacterium]|nr:hypothetical protein [Defluviitaleaceae bacterium]
MVRRLCEFSHERIRVNLRKSVKSVSKGTYCKKYVQDSKAVERGFTRILRIRSCVY